MYVLSQYPILMKLLDERLGTNIFIVFELVTDKMNILELRTQKKKLTKYK